jgi:hypothetical protein
VSFLYFLSETATYKKLKIPKSSSSASRNWNNSLINPMKRVSGKSVNVSANLVVRQ